MPTFRVFLSPAAAAVDRMSATMDFNAEKYRWTTGSSDDTNPGELDIWDSKTDETVATFAAGSWLLVRNTQFEV